MYTSRASKGLRCWLWDFPTQRPASHRDSSALLDTQCNWKILPCSRCQLDIPYLGHQRRRNGRMFWWKPIKMWPKQIPRSDKLQRHGYGYGSKPWCADGTPSHSWWMDAYSPRFWPISKMPRSKIHLGLVHTFPWRQLWQRLELAALTCRGDGPLWSLLLFGVKVMKDHASIWKSHSKNVGA